MLPNSLVQISEESTRSVFTVLLGYQKNSLFVYFFNAESTRPQFVPQEDVNGAEIPPPGGFWKIRSRRKGSLRAKVPNSSLRKRHQSMESIAKSAQFGLMRRLSNEDSYATVA